MKIRLQKLLICSYLCCASALVSAANFYILFDANCMDRLVYARTGTDNAEAYIVYSLRVSDTERLVLEIGAANKATQEVAPNNVIGCDNSVLTPDMVRRINSNSDRVFVVVRNPNNTYTVHQAMQAAYFWNTGDQMRYESMNYNFELDTRRGVIGDNISVNKNAEVYFDGKIDNDRAGVFLFRHIMAKTAQPFTVIELLPEVGISELRSGQNPDDAFNNILRLEKVNDQTVGDYLRARGKDTNKTFTAKGIPDSFENTRPARTTAASNANNTSANPCNETSGNGVHIVQRGETLYGISRLYGVTVAQIRQWSGLSDNTVIRPCDKLIVTARTTPNTSSGAIANNTPVGNMPAPYEQTPRTPLPPNNEPPAWKTTNGYHVVLRGETVASIAMKYGYTEARFRDMNGLAKDEVVKVGQPLRTIDSGSNVANTIPREFDTGATLTAKSPYAATITEDTRITPQFHMPAETAQMYPRSGSTLSPELQDRMRSTRQPSTSRTTSPADTPSTYYDDTVPQSYDSGATRRRQIHTVKEGENLYRIAQLYGTTVDRLLQLNNMNANEVLLPYQRIFVN